MRSWVKNHRVRFATPVLVLVMMLMLNGCSALFPAEEPMLAPPLIESQAVEYVTTPVVLGSIEDKLTNMAYFGPSVQSNVMFEFSGRLESVSIYNGAQVLEGEVLARFITEGTQTQIRDKKFAIEKLRLSLEEAEARESQDSALYAEHDGVITQLKAVAGDKAEDIQRRYGALAYIVGPESRLSIVVHDVDIKVALGVTVYVDVDGMRVSGVVEEVTGGNNVDLWKPPLPSASPQPTMVWNGSITVRLDENSRLPVGSEAKVSLVVSDFYLGTGRIEAAAGSVTGTGVIEQVLVEEGQQVRRGEMLMIMASDTYSSRGINVDLRKAEAELRDLEIELERSEVFAPITGKVTWMNDALVINDRIEANTLLARIADRSSMVLDYKGEKATLYPLGLKVTIRYKGNEYAGEVVGNPDTFPADKSGAKQKIVRFQVEGFDMLSPEISDGDGASVEAMFQRKDDVIVLQKQYVQSFLGRKYVNILVNGIKEERDVEIGIETATESEIVKGLQVGDQLIIR